MDISFIENETKIIFKISNFDSEYNSVFQNCFYKLDGSSYIKEFQKEMSMLY